MVSAVNTAQATSTINSGIGALANNYETFLKLLTTQLKNQDPLSPLDTNEFTSQLTAMTGVQQQLLTNQLLTQMISQNQADIGGAAINLIGKNVTMETTSTMLKSGEATWTYNLAGGADKTKLEVLDANGKVVNTINATDNAKGQHTYTWNGKDAAGRALPEGSYDLRVTPTDANDRLIASTVVVTGIASRIENINGVTLLTVGRSRAPLNAITSVSEVTPAPTPEPTA